ncbi:glycosyltransferase family 2 protein [Paracoccus sp. 11-3]|uniref:Glycosyltransferase family 2 protein n=1 Tax=Paracoccus amoyensis TaxID=2760093 RepID=A0A926GAK1_9RHOB|nr:glycosyltransferase family 2 protein [Paracoccus amoyensis]MBC9246396.1 glycosyltransferase family 2 protein [Paracoccus amoyensis]
MISDLFRQFKHGRRIARAKADLNTRPLNKGRDHGLPAPLVVSLTSYAARFDTLALTLRGLLGQTVRPDHVILWLDEGDVSKVPPEVQALTASGLQIEVCPGWRSYKKIVPTLLKYPDSYIVTADDDVYYDADWLDGLVAAAQGGAAIACHRAHLVTLDATGKPRPYVDWDHNIEQAQKSPLVFLTGVSGVIYAPGSLHPDVTNADRFTQLAPRSDDVWLYWMHRLNGVEAQKIGAKARILEWDGSQAQSLRSENLHGTGNDQAIDALLKHYGWPVSR